MSEVSDDRVLSLAAEAAFWALLSLPPLALAMLGLLGYVAPLFGSHAVATLREDILTAAGHVFSGPTIDKTVTPLLDNLLGQGRPSLVSTGFVLSLWSGSAAMSSYVRTITIAYDMPDLRPAWRTRLLGFLLYLGSLAVTIVLLPALVIGPQAIADLVPGEVQSVVTTTVHLVYWPTVAAFTVAVVATLYHLAVPVRTPWVRDLPGAVLAMALWLAGSVGLRVYFAVGSASPSRTGTLGAPVAILLFFYVTAFAVLMGAELNAEIDARWPVRETSEGRARQAATAAGQ